MKRPIQTSSTVKPACLSYDNKVERYLIASGFARQSSANSRTIGEGNDQDLKYAFFKEVRHSKMCENWFVCLDRLNKRSLDLPCLDDSGKLFCFFISFRHLNVLNFILLY